MRAIKTGPSRRTFVAASLASGLALAMPLVPTQGQNRRLPIQIAIRANSQIMTLINVFVVEPDNEEKLIQLLKEGTETLSSKQPGYIAASFHKSKDGRRVVNYRSSEDIEGFRRRPEIAEYFKRLRELAEFEAVVCEVSYVHHL